MLTEVRCPPGEPADEVAGLMRLPSEMEPAPISFGSNFASLAIAVDEAQAYAEAPGIPVNYVRREA